MRTFLNSLGLAALIAAQAAIPQTANAEQLGYGRLIVNDFLGDGHDRWRSGSIAASHVYGAQWNGGLPEGFGEILELRVLGQVIAPENLQSPAAGDRAYAGALSVGLHSHFQRQNTEFSLGADVTVVGPQSGIGDIQSALHDLFGVARPSDAVLNNQVGNEITLTAVGEVGRSFDLGPGTTVRPFIEGRVGDETMVRAGFDLTVGGFGANSLLVRDPVSGQRYTTISAPTPGLSFVLGADIAYVDDSIYLPASSGVSLEDMRHRVRAGLHWQGKSHSIYYGASWLSPEFTGQSEGQVVGALRIKFDF